MIEAIIIIIILVLIIYYFTMMPSASTSASTSTTEKFSPYVSTLTHDIRRSDPAFDRWVVDDTANPLGRSSEYLLFNQTNGWIYPSITPLEDPSIDLSKYDLTNIPAARGYSST